MIGMTINSQNLFGLPERSSPFLLQTTENTDPYRLYNVDYFPHNEASMKGLYSSLPFIQGHSSNHDEGVMLYNPSETWVDITNWKDEEKQNRQRHVNFIKEAGKLELYIMASASEDKLMTPPKRISNLIARISGFPQLPPFYSIGFHYSKWESSTSALRTI